MKLNSLAIIPARKNSKGIKNKNLIKIKSKSLIEIAFQEAKKSKYVQHLIFSTDCSKMKKIANNNSIKTYSMRPKKLSTDKANIFQVLEYETSYFEREHDIKIDYVILLQPTTPFRTYKIIDDTLKHFQKNYKTCDSLITITDLDYPLNWNLKVKKNYIRNVFKNGNKITRRQETGKYFKPNGMVYVVKRKILKSLKKKILPTNKTLFYFINKDISVNIDNHRDFLLAKLIQKEKRIQNL